MICFADVRTASGQRLRLALDAASLAEAEARCGRCFTVAESWRTLNARGLRALLTAAARAAGEDVTEHEIGAAVGLADIAAATRALGEIVEEPIRQLVAARTRPGPRRSN